MSDTDLLTPKALIFDVDGTLAETEEHHRLAYNAVFAEMALGWEWSRGDYQALYRITGGKERMRLYRDERAEQSPDAADIAEIYRRKTALYGARIAQGSIALRPGVRELVATARAAGLKLAVATTTGAANVDALCRACWGRNAAEVFDVVVAGEDVDAKKPAPEAFEAVLRQLDLAPDQAVAFEDSHNGLVSALAAGLRVMITPALYTSAEDFSEATWLRADLTGVTVAPSGALIIPV